MGRRIVQISPNFLQKIITKGWSAGEDQIVRVLEGIPETAKFVRCWTDQSVGRDGTFFLLFEDPSWEGPDETESALIITIVFQSEAFR